MKISYEIVFDVKHFRTDFGTKKIISQLDSKNNTVSMSSK